MSDQLIGQTLADKYRIEEALRENGAGSFYRATHLLMDKSVCVKILAPDAAADDQIVKQFSSEAKTVSRISHPNILNVTDFGTDKNGAIYTVFENADGETLKQAIAREGKFAFERAVKTIQQIAAAASVAHKNGVLHAHLDSENILLNRTADESEVVKVLGFGASETIKQENSFDETAAKNFEYLAPEQNAFASEMDERSNVYNLGVIFYEMLTGELPFVAASSDELERKQSENPPSPLSAFRSDLPEGIGFIVLKALSKNPDMRYQTVNAFAEDLSRAASNFGETETIVIPRASDNTRNNLWKTAFVVLAGISLLAATLIFATSVKQTNVQTQLQTDANGQPVQPINPATGINEQGLSNMVPPTTATTGNSMIDMTVPQPIQGGGAVVSSGDGYGDGYNPWARGGIPPAGAPPQSILPGGQVIMIPGDGNSQFMPNDGGYILVPANANTAQPSPTPKTGKSPAPPANTAQPTPTPKVDKQTPPADTKPTPAPKTENPVKPADKPKLNTPTSNEKQKQSGQEQNS